MFDIKEYCSSCEPVFQYETSKLFCSSILNKSIIEENSIDVFITSPPYNVGINYNALTDDGSYDSYLEFTDLNKKYSYFIRKFTYSCLISCLNFYFLV